MISFKNDYSEIAHPSILTLMQKHSQTQFNGYGLDVLSISVKQTIQSMLHANVDIHFLVGGTITNKVLISHALRPYEAVISADTGHIFVHETGAIESTGHQILLIPNTNGKLTVPLIEDTLKGFSDEHRVVPKLVYISNATETGTFYTKSELQALYRFCQSRDLYLFIDGARLGVALAASGLTLNDICENSDAFYIGGTKNGAMLGEALVIKSESLKPFFRHAIKQSGGLLAKGFVAAIQFEGLFQNNLFFDLGTHANAMAAKITSGLIHLGIIPIYPVSTNQIFITLKKTQVDILSKNYAFEIWTDHGFEQTIRLVTSWFTTETMVQTLLKDIESIL
jgi:threonine aldolase